MALASAPGVAGGERRFADAEYAVTKQLLAHDGRGAAQLRKGRRERWLVLSSALRDQCGQRKTPPRPRRPDAPLQLGGVVGAAQRLADAAAAAQLAYDAQHPQLARLHPCARGETRRAPRHRRLQL